jgi:hypothetical protein
MWGINAHETMRWRLTPPLQPGARTIVLSTKRVLKQSLRSLLMPFHPTTKYGVASISGQFKINAVVCRLTTVDQSR